MFPALAYAARSSDGNPALGAVILYALIIGYFLPTFVSIAREHHQKPAIIALNLLLGWTVLGWIGALVWSLTAVRKDFS